MCDRDRGRTEWKPGPGGGCIRGAHGELLRVALLRAPCPFSAPVAPVDTPVRTLEPVTEGCCQGARQQGRTPATWRSPAQRRAPAGANTLALRSNAPAIAPASIASTAESLRTEPV